jgi:hypothetical protein
MGLKTAHSVGMSAPDSSPNLKPIILFNACYMLAAVAASMRMGNKEFIFYIVVMLVLIGVMAVVHRRVRLTAPLLWAFSIWGFLHMAGGLCPLPKGWPYNGDQAVLYSWWLIPGLLKYDQIVHAFGFGTTTCLCWHAVRQMFRAEDGRMVKPSLGVLILCEAAGMGFGALNEVVEFIAVLTIPNTNVGGYENTGWDLVANMTGTFLAALGIRFASKG